MSGGFGKDPAPHLRPKATTGLEEAGFDFFRQGSERPERPSGWERSHPGGHSRVAPTWLRDRRSGPKECQASRIGLTQWIIRPAWSPCRRKESNSSGWQTVHMAAADPR